MRPNTQDCRHSPLEGGGGAASATRAQRAAAQRRAQQAQHIKSPRSSSGSGSGPMSPTHGAGAGGDADADGADLMCAAPWTKSAEQVAEELGVDVRVGLDEAEVAARQARFGLNELRKEPGKPMWRLVLEQFDDMLVKVSGRGRGRGRGRGPRGSSMDAYDPRGCRRCCCAAAPRRNSPPPFSPHHQHI